MADIGWQDTFYPGGNGALVPNWYDNTRHGGSFPTYGANINYTDTPGRARISNLPDEYTGEIQSQTITLDTTDYKYVNVKITDTIPGSGRISIGIFNADHDLIYVLLSLFGDGFYTADISSAFPISNQVNSFEIHILTEYPEDASFMELGYIEVSKNDLEHAIAAPVISNFAVTNITDSIFIVSWTTDIPIYGIVGYGIDIPETFTEVEGGKTTSHSVIVQGLSPATDYWARACNTDSEGNVLSFQYLGNTIHTQPVITNLVVGLPADTSIGVSFVTGMVWARTHIEYGTGSSSWFTPIDTLSELYHPVTLSSLTPGTTYWWKAQCLDISDNIITSTDGPEFTTTGNIPPPFLQDWTWFRNLFISKYGSQWSDAFIRVVYNRYLDGDLDDSLGWVFPMFIDEM